jgi:rhodanese-related sulfurtransferase
MFVVLLLLQLLQLYDHKLAAVPISREVLTQQPRLYGQYCGIDCVYAGAKAIEKTVPHFKMQACYDQLIDESYVSTLTGSTDADLIRAAESVGCHATRHNMLSWLSLQAAQCPLILNVSPRGRIGNYRHWVLFTGIVNGKARILDQGEQYNWLPQELLSRWNGFAIALSAHPAQHPFYGVELRRALAAIVVVSLIVMIASRWRRTVRSGTWLPYVLGLIGCLTLLSFIFEPVMVSVDLAQAIAIETKTRTLESITLKDLKQRLGSGDTVLIDCRYQTDFELGSIPGAISLPVDCSKREIESRMATLPTERQLVLFCQSAGCHFSDVMGAELIKLGYSKLVVYRAGYREWQEASR